jgi:DNA-directed RNA polymerase subunit omega
VEEEVIDLIATDENIFGVMDVSDEQAAEAGMQVEDMSGDDLEAAIAAELGGRR